MVRRVLEEVCEDKEAKGKDLKARVAALGGAALIPKELIEAADELRILGNDAAHVKATVRLADVVKGSRAMAEAFS